MESGSNVGVKPVEFRKKKRGGALKDSIGNKKITAMMPSGHFWRSKTGNTTKSDSVNMEEKFLVKKTSFNYGESSAFTSENSEQTPKRKIDFLSDDGNDIFLDKLVVFSPLLKNLVNVSVRKSFTLDISLDNVVGNSAQKKFVVAQASKKTENAKILVNINLKKSTSCLDQAVVVKEIPVETLSETVRAAFFEFGSVVSIKMQLVGLWQKAVMEFAQSNQANLHKALLYTLLMGTNAHNIWDFIGFISGKTCVIDCHLVIYARTKCATICFKSADLLAVVLMSIPVLRSTNLHWSCLVPAKCVKYRSLGHMSLGCNVGRKFSSSASKLRAFSKTDKSRLAIIYAKRLAPITRPVAFGGVLWASVISRFSFPSFSVCNSSVKFGSSLKIKPTMPAVINLESQLVSNIIMEEDSGEATSSNAAMILNLSTSPKVAKLEELLKGLSVLVLSLLACIDDMVLAGGVLPFIPPQ
ncbi:hypothetical protein G9A89_006620 [Geosiphon pyriformis]|nr:hypothetical protein G9A89_006620 [Geosiphon pyriformis]